MSRFFPGGPLRGDRWDPKYPDTARLPNAGSDREGELSPLDQGTDDGSVPWVFPPNVGHISHVHSFRYFGEDDPKLGRFIRRFLGGVSVLMVRFVAKKTGRISEYHYRFTDAKRGRAIFEEMAATDSPWTIGYQKLEKAGVPYTEIT